MFSRTYSHNILRKYVVLFGTLFNNIFVTRENSSGETVQTIEVPLSYGPKEKFLARLQGDPNLTNQVGIVLPRMSFEMTTFTYDPSRKLNTLNKNYIATTDPNSYGYQYQPVPYDINFQLSIMVKNAVDGTKIVEQILPYFTPAWTVSVKLIDGLPSYDIPIVLNDVAMEDTYEGNFETRRAIIWTLNFTMKAYVFGPTRTTGLITFAEANIKDSITTNTLATITSTPGLTANGQPTSNAAESVAVTQISLNDNYGFIIDITENE